MPCILGGSANYNVRIQVITGGQQIHKYIQTYSNIFFKMYCQNTSYHRGADKHEIMNDI